MLTHNDKLTAVTDWIAGIVPGVMPDVDNLKEGDKFKRKQSDRVLCCKENYQVNGTHMIDYKDIESGSSYCSYRYNELKPTITGVPRDIWLHDVMRALGRKNSPEYTRKIYLISQKGELVVAGEDYIDYTNIYWDFSNPLHLQSESLINWLWEVKGGEG